MDGHKNIPKRNDLTTRIATNYCAELSDSNSTGVIRIVSKTIGLYKQTRVTCDIRRIFFSIYVFFSTFKYVFDLKKENGSGRTTR